MVDRDCSTALHQNSAEGAIAMAIVFDGHLVIGLASDDVTKNSNAWQRGKIGSKQRQHPIQNHAGRKVCHWAELFITLWRGLNGLDNSLSLGAVRNFRSFFLIRIPDEKGEGSWPNTNFEKV